VLQDLPRTLQGYENIITATDSATRYFVAKATKQRTAKDIAKFLFEEIVVNFGAPVELVSDRASSFLSEVLQEYLKVLETRHLPTSPYHPRSNGMAERPHSTFNNILTRLCAGFPNQWDKFVPQAVLAMRVRIHSVTGFSPYFLAYGLQPRLPGDHLPFDLHDFSGLDDPHEWTARELESLGQARAAAHFRSLSQKNRTIDRYNNQNNVTGHKFQLGEYVKRKNHTKSKFQTHFHGPFIIMEIGPNDTYRIMYPNGKMYESLVHHDDLAEYNSTETDIYHTPTGVHGVDDDIEVEGSSV
jgi:hypothetical protein